MGWWFGFAAGLCFISFLTPLLIFFFYPFLLAILAGGRRQKQVPLLRLPSISCVVVVHNGEAGIRRKIENLLALDYPQELLEIIVSDDGSTDATAAMVEASAGPRVRLLRHAEHRGKNPSLNDAVSAARGEILVLTDLEALLEGNALRAMARNLSDPEVGGVCGQMVIVKDQRTLSSPQKKYLQFDSLLKRLESRLGFLTSNTGALCAFRRELLQTVPPTVTDDLYLALTVIRKHRRFVFEPEARASLAARSRGPGHEIRRRRRIVGRSLTGLFLMRELFNPRKYGLFSFCLFTNKVVRRLLPFSFVMLLGSTGILALWSSAARLAFLAQTLFWCLPLLCLLPQQWRQHLGPLGKIPALALFFLLGNVGTALGVMDFLAGKSAAKWDLGQRG